MAGPRGVNPRDTALLQRRLWTPNVYTEGAPFLWFDAADLPTLVFSGANVTNWNNKVPGASNLNASGGTTYRSNPRPAIDVGATNSFIVAGGANFTLTSRMLFGVYTLPPSNATYRVLYLQTSGSVYPAIFQTATDNLTTYNASYGSTAGVVPVNTRFLTSLQEDASNNVTESVNGNPLVSTARAGAPSIQTFLGDAAGSAMTAHEIIGYPALLSLPQQQRIEGYLAWKWWGSGHPLPANHLYSRRPPYLGDF